MKRTMLFLILAMGLMIGLAVPAAALARDGIVHCGGDGLLYGECYSVRGIAANVRMADWTLGCTFTDSGHVDSLYLTAYSGEGEVNVHPSIEIGWVQDRIHPNCVGGGGYGAKQIFFKAYNPSGGVTWEHKANASDFAPAGASVNGGWRLLLSQPSAGKVRAQFDPPWCSPGACRLTPFPDHFMSESGWGSVSHGQVLTAMEVSNPGSSSVPASAAPYHLNMWVQYGTSAPFSWKAANPGNSISVTFQNNSMPTYWYGVTTRGSGSSGDDQRYYRA